MKFEVKEITKKEKRSKPQQKSVSRIKVYHDELCREIEKKKRKKTDLSFPSLAMAAPAQANTLPPPTADIDEVIQLLINDGKRRAEDVSKQERNAFSRETLSINFSPSTSSK